MHQKLTRNFLLLSDVRPCTDAAADDGAEIDDDDVDVERTVAFQGASEIDEAKTGSVVDGVNDPSCCVNAKLSTPTRRENSAARTPSGLRQPCAAAPSANAGPEAPQGQSVAFDEEEGEEEAEQEFAEEKSSTTLLRVYPMSPATSA